MDAQNPSMQLLAEAAQNQTPLPNNLLDDEENRSSSLSELDDNNESEVEALSDNEVSPGASGDEDEERDEDNEAERDDQDGNDTEAETERLEESPDKQRRQRKVLLNADNEAVNTDTTPIKQSGTPAKGSVDQEDDIMNDANSDILDATSPISSPSDTADEGSPPASPQSSSSRKRKRGEHTSPSTKRAAMQLLKNSMGDKLTKSEQASAEFVVKTASGRQKVKGVDLLDDSAAGSPIENNIEETEDNPEEVESNEEAELDEGAPEVDVNTKSEADLAVRKEAADKVSNIEEQFAIFRDRMYGEAVANINAELASLESEDPTHPEYLAIGAAIARQREARERLAKSRFSLQVKNWQQRGKADKALYFSQYAQACRDIRDGALTKASDEWYQIQRGRRSVDDSLTTPSLTAYKRIDLVAQQTAYNTEVSILSGIAKHVGFPAAPEIGGASATEIEDDLRTLGMTMPMPQSQVSTSISQYLRQNLAAEKQFSKVTPWANAQHHSHGLHAAYSWSPARPNSPFTPATQSHQGDVPIAGGSASTIVGSHAPTPLSSEVTGSNSKGRAYNGIGETPSRAPQTERPRSIVQQGYATPRVNGSNDYQTSGNVMPELKMGLA